MGIKDNKRIYDTDDLAPGKRIIFACTGVTEGSLLRGVSLRRRRAHALVILTLEEREVRFVDSVRLEKRPDVKVRFA